MTKIEDRLHELAARGMALVAEMERYYEGAIQEAQPEQEDQRTA